MDTIYGYKNKVRYNGDELTCIILRYSADNSVALQLVDEEGMPYNTATVFCESTCRKVKNYCKDKHVAIKNYSENTGIERALINAGILKNRVAAVQHEYVTFPIYEINTNPRDIEKLNLPL